MMVRRGNMISALDNDRFRKQVESTLGKRVGGASTGVRPSMSMHQDNSLRPLLLFGVLSFGGTPLRGFRPRGVQASPELMC
jgi:hypothetical protein